MIGYATLGTNDLPRAIAFYDALLVEIGAKHLCGADVNAGRDRLDLQFSDSMFQ